jgi:hypothetical protein
MKISFAKQLMLVGIHHTPPDVPMPLASSVQK